MPDMTPEIAAAIAARAYRHMAPWSAAQIAASCDSPHSVFLASDQGFVLSRLVAGEAEILAFAIDPAAQRQGQARALLDRLHAALCARGATQVFLEVAADNAPAIALYLSQGYQRRGTRPGYYHRALGGPADALLMSRALAE